MMSVPLRNWVAGIIMSDLQNLQKEAESSKRGTKTKAPGRGARGEISGRAGSVAAAPSPRREHHRGALDRVHFAREDELHRGVLQREFPEEVAPGVFREEEGSIQRVDTGRA